MSAPRWPEILSTAVSPLPREHTHENRERFSCYVGKSFPHASPPGPTCTPFAHPPGSSGHCRHLPAKASMTRILAIFRIWECSYWVISPKPSIPTAPGASQPESSSIWFKVALTKAGAAWQKWISVRGPHHHHHISFRNADTWDFLGCPVVKTLSSQLKGPQYNPRYQNKGLPCLGQKKKKKEEIKILGLILDLQNQKLEARPSLLCFSVSVFQRAPRVATL